MDLFDWRSIGNVSDINASPYCESVTPAVPLNGIIPSDSFRTFHYLVFVSSLTITLTGLCAFIILKRYLLLLKSRSTYHVLCIGLASLGVNFLFTFTELRGRHSVLCGSFISVLYFTLALVISTFPTFIFGYILKVIETHERMQCLENDLPFTPKNRTRGGFPNFPRILKLLWSSKVGVLSHSTADRIILSPTRSAMARDEAISRLRLRNVIENYVSAPWIENIIIPIVTGFCFGTPVILILMIRLTTSTKFYNNCVGCELEILDLYLFLFVSICIFGFLGFLLFKTRREIDPLLLRREIAICLVIASPAGFLGFIFAAIDLAGLHSTYQFSYYCLLIISVTSLFCCVCWFPILVSVYHRIRGALRRRKALDIPLEVILKHPVTSTLFMKHCIAEISAENLLFLDEVNRWRTVYDSEDPHYIFEKASVLVDTFISQGAVFQVNISDRVRDKVVVNMSATRAIGESRPPADLFNEAFSDVYDLVTNDALVRFMEGSVWKTRVLQTPVIDELYVSNSLANHVRGTATLGAIQRISSLSAATFATANANANARPISHKSSSYFPQINSDLGFPIRLDSNDTSASSR